jgi:lactam utilization protein B
VKPPRNDAHKNRALADVMIDAMQSIDPALAIAAPDRSQMAAAARAAGLPVIREAFADRRYEPDGSLTPRSLAGSKLTIEEAAAQAALLVTEGVAIARDGTRIPIAFDTICIHADMENHRRTTPRRPIADRRRADRCDADQRRNTRRLGWREIDVSIERGTAG